MRTQRGSVVPSARHVSSTHGRLALSRAWVVTLRPLIDGSAIKGEIMADKKVERSGRERPITPTQKMKASLSDPGTVNVADTAHDKGKSTLVDKYREREERWRREQAFHAQQGQQGREEAEIAQPPEAVDALESLAHAGPPTGAAPAAKEGRPKGGVL